MWCESFKNFWKTLKCSKFETSLRRHGWENSYFRVGELWAHSRLLNKKHRIYILGNCYKTSMVFSLEEASIWGTGKTVKKIKNVFVKNYKDIIKNVKELERVLSPNSLDYIKTEQG